MRNDNPRVAFRDLLYITTYRDEGGQVVEERHEFIKDIFEPGELCHLTVNDGYVRTNFATASLEIVSAEALLPAPGFSK